MNYRIYIEYNRMYRIYFYKLLFDCIHVLNFTDQKSTTDRINTFEYELFN